jgi:alkylhydroperoxidase family enzyme
MEGRMSAERIPPLGMSELSVEAEQLVSATRVGWDQPQNIFLTLARRPDLLRGVNRLGHRLLFEGTIGPRLREIAILRISWRCACVYEFGQHTVIGGRNGLTGSEIDALCLPDPRAYDQWDRADIAVIEAVDELYFRDTMTDAGWDRLRSVLTEDQLIEFVLLVGYYRMLAAFLNSAGVHPDSGLPGWTRRA